MKNLARPLNWVAIALFIAVPIFYFNCSSRSGSSAGALSSSSMSQSHAPTSGPSGATNLSYSAGLGPTNTLLAYQDHLFTFTPDSSADPGPFHVSGLPAWATFDSTSGKVTGVPRALPSTDAAFLVTGSQSGRVFGPVSVHVVGNPLKEFQWHLNNTGQNAFALNGGVAGEDLHMSETVQSGVTGAGVRIAFSDSGALLSHEALAANILTGESRNYLNIYAQTKSWIGDPTPSLGQSDNAHGTAVASLASEKGWNGVGGRGVAPDTGIAAFLFIQAQSQLASEGMASAGFYDQFSGNFDIFNYSWGDPQCELYEYPETMNEKLAYAVTHQRSGLGSILLMAGGNSYVTDIQDCYSGDSSSPIFGNANFSELQTSPYVLNIAAVNANGVASSYSTPGSNLWVSAPGGEFGYDSYYPGSLDITMPAIIAADFEGCTVGLKTEAEGYSQFDAGAAPNTECNYVSTMNGTSAATPVASGSVALLLEVNPKLTWRDVKYILAKTADKIDPAVNPAHHPESEYDLIGHQYDLPWITNAAGFNFMNYYGFGRINVDKAVALARTYTSSLGTLTQTNWSHNSGNINLPIPDHSASGVRSTLSANENLVIESVQARVSLSGCVGDMGLELTAPSGTKSILLNINSRIQDGALNSHVFLSNAFYGEHTQGAWTLAVIDAYPGCTATLTNWQLNFLGH